MSQKPLWYRWARVGVVGFSIIATGSLLFKYTVPTDEQLIAKFSPEIRAEYERNREIRQKEQQELMKIARETAASDDPIWKTGRIKSPFEKDGRNTDPKLVDIEKYNRERGDEFKKSEVERAQQELREAEELVSQKKGWFSRK
ncbi:DEHA2G14124p [Debaryomyces hansenii CBS767]|uniref:Assembly factor CBP4 n=1 Tax=Debaryomyces hansenii (strain ATCC 36239 / CBS 767 / BCRC 21394 / JCM 1990 / NBRC 0083 / IGC 2968) TaxID=284592 RepID=CBP4_DEBHA|nr:DEHA2G14124p [Debaryomyces hansenii CBS767]Q6BI17.2 RecName: Full=Assembly factor CBP4; AltName: Full=Cytochrome b mRNA-processing protein 4 [Debaryomyces hansenii CBS767]CAG90640.2 DEHA2G14124p [Debaryomyces hansenii CBS767]|eukprot:XP_462154.2 DEHA2G14124p [Debaryomyces hansenii CBS767]